MRCWISCGASLTQLKGTVMYLDWAHEEEKEGITRDELKKLE